MQHIQTITRNQSNWNTSKTFSGANAKKDPSIKPNHAKAYLGVVELELLTVPALPVLLLVTPPPPPPEAEPFAALRGVLAIPP